MLAKDLAGMTFADQLQRAFLADDPHAEQRDIEHGHVQLVRQQYDAIARGDFEAILETVTDDIEFEIVSQTPLPFVHAAKGRAGLTAHLRKNFSQLDDQRPEILAAVAQGNLLAVFGIEHGRIRATGQPYAAHWAHLFTFRGGKVARLREFVDTGPLLGAAATPAS